MTKKRSGGDILRDPRFKKFARSVQEDLVPAMKGSAYVMTIAPDGGAVDVKIAVEIGFAILLDKPLIVLKMPGRPVAERLLRIADHVVEGDMTTEAGKEAMFAKLKAVMNQ